MSHLAGFVAVILFLILLRVIRGFSARKKPDGIARMNAAAERILKEQRKAAANPQPAMTAAQATKAQRQQERQARTAKSSFPPTKAAAPTKAFTLQTTRVSAIQRRGTGLLSTKEPVIQRRR